MRTHLRDRTLEPYLMRKRMIGTRDFMNPIYSNDALYH